MPSWVRREMNYSVFQFYYNGKPDLVTREAIVQPPSCGGFSVVNVQLKVWALLLQWVRRFSFCVDLFFLFLVQSGFWCFSCPDSLQSASVSWRWWVARFLLSPLECLEVCQRCLLA